MTLSELYNLTNFIINKDNGGTTLTPENFEDLVNRRQLDYFQEEYMSYEVTTGITDALRTFKTIIDQDDVSVVSSSYFALPSNYAHFGSMSYVNADGSYSPFDMVTKSQAIMRKASTLTTPSTTYPICYEFDNKLYLETYSAALSFTMTYLRYPTDVVLDYYIDVNGGFQYLAASATHNWVAGEYDSAGNLKTGAESQYTSLTVELEWNEDDQFKILEYILRDVGISINEEGVYQYASISKNES